jgi:hypothetical protein
LRREIGRLHVNSEHSHHRELLNGCTVAVPRINWEPIGHPPLGTFLIQTDASFKTWYVTGTNQAQFGGEVRVLSVLHCASNLAPNNDVSSSAAIGSLQENVILDILEFCLPHFGHFPDYRAKAWFKLVHIFMSTPSRSAPFCTSYSCYLLLDVWPPCLSRYGRTLVISGIDVIAALEHPDHVREIWFFEIRSPPQRW